MRSLSSPVVCYLASSLARLLPFICYDKVARGVCAFCLGMPCLPHHDEVSPGNYKPEINSFLPYAASGCMFCPNSKKVTEALFYYIFLNLEKHILDAYLVPRVKKLNFYLSPTSILPNIFHAISGPG